MMSDKEAALKAVNQTIADFGDDDPERSLDIEWGNVEIRVKHLETIRAALAEPEWRPEHEAPWNETLITYGSAGIRFSYKDDNDQWRSMMHKPFLKAPTHWMLMPLPPKGKTP